MSAKHTRAAMEAAREIAGLDWYLHREVYQAKTTTIIDRHFAALVEAAEASVESEKSIAKVSGRGVQSWAYALESALRAVKGD